MTRAPRDIYFGGLEPVGGQRSGIDISSATTLSRPDGANLLILQSLDQNAYYTLDGTTPAVSPSVGFLLKADDPPIAIPMAVNTVVNIIEAAATARLQYQWFE